MTTALQDSCHIISTFSDEESEVCSGCSRSINKWQYWDLKPDCLISKHIAFTTEPGMKHLLHELRLLQITTRTKPRTKTMLLACLL